MQTNETEKTSEKPEMTEVEEHDQMEDIDPKSREFYCKAIETLTKANLPFLVGGAYASQRYTGISRHTKDLDIFVRKEDTEKIMGIFREAGYKAEITFSHWLGKVYCEEFFVDVIFASGNGLAPVDSEWFEHAPEEKVFDMTVKICPPEEIIWSKAFVMERERYDGADVAHLLQAVGETLDWQRLLRRFGQHWPVLYSHLILFNFIYPEEKHKIPDWVMDELAGRMSQYRQSDPPDEKVCQGTLISREQYLLDTHQRGYKDGRLPPSGNMTAQQIEDWTDAIGKIK
jgi:hypothetical protein